MILLSHRTLPLLDLKLLRKERFILLGKETRMRDMIDFSLAQAVFHPSVLCGPQSPHRLFHGGPEAAVDPERAFLKGCYLIRPEKYFIALATEYTRGRLKEAMGS